jgi:hypothetical protein
MPTPVHEAFSRLLAEHLRHELDSISRNNEKARSFASNIRSVGSSRILLREGIDTTDSAWPRRQPDEQFQHKDATYPGVVIEVSYSQDGKALRRLAQEYILYSNGDIKLVLGIDINETAECTVSTWRPRYIQAADEDIDELVVFQELASRVSQPSSDQFHTYLFGFKAFRSVDGDPVNEDDRVEIPLSDFATDEIFCGDKAANVSIPFTSLAHFLKQAEEVHAAREPREGQRSIRSSRKTRKRPLSSSSAEELMSEDEAKFLAREEQASSRSAAVDADFITVGAKRRF